MIGTRVDTYISQKAEQEICKGMFHADHSCDHIGGTHSLGPLYGTVSKFTARNERRNRSEPKNAIAGE